MVWLNTNISLGYITLPMPNANGMDARPSSCSLPTLWLKHTRTPTPFLPLAARLLSCPDVELLRVQRVQFRDSGSLWLAIGSQVAFIIYMNFFSLLGHFVVGASCVFILASRV